MTGPQGLNPHPDRPPKTDASSKAQWWIVWDTTGKFNSIANIVSSPTKPLATPGELVQGPFGSKEAAQAAASATGGPAGTPPVAGFTPGVGLGAISHWIGVFVEGITNVHMWISIGWLLLGVSLVLIGIALWLRLPQRAADIAVRAAGAA